MELGFSNLASKWGYRQEIDHLEHSPDFPFGQCKSLLLARECDKSVIKHFGATPKGDEAPLQAPGKVKYAS